MRDVFTDALSAPSGQLAEVLINKVTKGDGSELPDDVRARLDRLIYAPGKPGLLALVRLAADVPYLFDRAPNWTTSRLIPLFDWYRRTPRTCGRRENTRTTLDRRNSSAS